MDVEKQLLLTTQACKNVSKTFGITSVEELKLMDAPGRQKQFPLSDALKSLLKGQLGLKNGHQHGSEIKVAEHNFKHIKKWERIRSRCLP